MSRLILISISILFFNNILLSANLDDCSWDNTVQLLMYTIKIGSSCKGNWKIITFKHRE